MPVLSVRGPGAAGVARELLKWMEDVRSKAASETTDGGSDSSSGVTVKSEAPASDDERQSVDLVSEADWGVDDLDLIEHVDDLDLC